MLPKSYVSALLQNALQWYSVDPENPWWCVCSEEERQHAMMLVLTMFRIFIFIEGQKKQAHMREKSEMHSSALCVCVCARVSHTHVLCSCLLDVSSERSRESAGRNACPPKNQTPFLPSLHPIVLLREPCFFEKNLFAHKLLTLIRHYLRCVPAMCRPSISWQYILDEDAGEQTAASVSLEFCVDNTG